MIACSTNLLRPVRRFPTPLLPFPRAASIPTLPDLFPDLRHVALRLEIKTDILLAVLPEQLNGLKGRHVLYGGGPDQLPIVPVHERLYLLHQSAFRGTEAGRMPEWPNANSAPVTPLPDLEFEFGNDPDSGTSKLRVTNFLPPLPVGSFALHSSDFSRSILPQQNRVMHLGIRFRHPDLRVIPIPMVVRGVVEDKGHFLVPKSGFESWR